MATKKNTTTATLKETATKSTTTKTATSSPKTTTTATTATATTATATKAPTTTRKTTRAKIDAPMIVRQVRRPTHEEIAQRAFLFFERRGYSHGQDVQDWVQAEMELQYKL